MVENSSKQIILSVIGIAILIIAVVGVSFAFFSYSKTSMASDYLTAGTLTFKFAEGDAINLQNHFPISTSDGKSLSSYNNGLCAFSVTGNISNGTTIHYTIYAVAGDEVNGKTRFSDDDIFINIRRTDNSGGTFTGVSKYTGSNASAIDSLGTGLKLGEATITGGAIDTVHEYEVRMWVDDSVVSIGELADVSEEEQPTYTAGEYSNKYYSLKIKIVAEDQK